MISDGFLLRRAQAGDENAREHLLARHRPTAWFLAREHTYPSCGLEWDDLRQEAMVGLNEAIRDYRPGHGSGFNHFANLCITRKLVTAVITANRSKHGPLNHATSLDAPLLGADDGLPLGDALPAPVTVAAKVEARETLRDLILAMDELTPLERGALVAQDDGPGRHPGESHQDIAARIGVTAKAIDNARQRAKRKLRRHLPAAA